MRITNNQKSKLYDDDGLVPGLRVGNIILIVHHHNNIIKRVVVMKIVVIMSSSSSMRVDNNTIIICNIIRSIVHFNTNG